MRAGIAKRLNKKGFTQQKIARELGLTQPAVSKYLSARYGPEIKAIETHKVLEEACDEIADKIAHGQWNSTQVTKAICNTCAQFNYEQLTCGLIEGVAKQKIRAV